MQGLGQEHQAQLYGQTGIRSLRADDRLINNCNNNNSNNTNCNLWFLFCFLDFHFSPIYWKRRSTQQQQQQLQQQKQKPLTHVHKNRRKKGQRNGSERRKKVMQKSIFSMKKLKFLGKLKNAEKKYFTLLVWRRARWRCRTQFLWSKNAKIKIGIFWKYSSNQH